MSTEFRFRALAAEPFAALFDYNDAQLQTIGARRLKADTHPGFPCRVSLCDAAIGETVLLLPHTHHDVASPYRAAGPIFVRQHARTAEPKVGEIPALLRERLLSLRAYDDGAVMIAAECGHGRDLEEAIDTLFADERVRYLHVHNARPGCFVCAVERT
jgi:hypothetical protein